MSSTRILRSIKDTLAAVTATCSFLNRLISSDTVAITHCGLQSIQADYPIDARGHRKVLRAPPSFLWQRQALLSVAPLSGRRGVRSQASRPGGGVPCIVDRTSFVIPTLIQVNQVDNVAQSARFQGRPAPGMVTRSSVSGGQ